MKLGAYYYDGWYMYRGNWTTRLMTEFDCRQPVWGWLGCTVESMEQQIEYAKQGGLSFFAFDWYYPEDGGEERGNNKCIDRYLAARNVSDLDFCLLVCNHHGAYIYYDTWKDAVSRWMRFLTSEHALKVDGKPVIIFFSAWDIVNKMETVERAHECFDYLREECVKAGLPGCYIMGCAGARRTEAGGTLPVEGNEEYYRSTTAMLASFGFDAITGYNYHRGKTVLSDGTEQYLLPYAELARDHVMVWEGLCHDKNIKYMPCLTGGWDNRPNEGPNRQAPSCYSPDITPDQVYDHIMECGKFQKEHADTVVDDLAVIYAWNENGEGGFICPTKGFHNDGILRACGRAVRDLNKN